MSAEFVAEEGVLRGLILSLDNGEEWSFGCDPTLATLVLEDPKVARKHLVCRKTSDGYVIENLSDKNPTLLNGNPFTGSKLLKEGDVVTIGGTVFHFYPEGLGPVYAFEPEYAFESEESFLGDYPSDDEQQAPEEEASKEEEVSEEEAISGEKEQAPEEMLEPLPEESVEEEIAPEEMSHPLEEEIVPIGLEHEEQILRPELPQENVEIPPEEMEMRDEEPFMAPLTEEEELEREEIFREVDEPPFTIDLTPTTRFVIKVIAGPNTGAEFALDYDHHYLIGTDPTTCDLIFNDLSVSREHARLSVNKEGEILIEDLNSRNGVVVDKERITTPKRLLANAVVALGTSAFLLIDREAPAETIMAPLFEAPPPEEEAKEEVIEEEPAPAVAAVAAHPRPKVGGGTLILALFVAGLAVLFGIGLVSLMQTKEVPVQKEDYLAQIQDVLKDFPAVRYTYNPTSGKLFLMGHVQTAVQLNELLYKLKGLVYLRGVENNIVNDEAVWQEMNILLSKMPEFKGVSMHSPQAGVFVISGYLKTEAQAADLIDYLNVNFNYLNLLQNRVVVEQQISDEISSDLIQHGFGAVTVVFSTGDLLLTGYVNSTQMYQYENLVTSFDKIPGVRSVKNYVVAVSPEQGVIDLNKRFPGKYRVTGFSKHGDVNINVVINGRILTRGDQVDDMTITSIQPHTIFLEKEGLKYKIEYNK